LRVFQISFELDENQEKKLNVWRTQIKNDPKVKNRPEKFIFSETGIGLVCEVTRGPFKIDLTDIENW